MTTLLIAFGAGLAFLVAYHTYGRWLGRKVFGLSADRVCPSHRLRDDNDYVPTPRSIVFGHHFTSIAGTGPIVGPAIAVMWGWVPALLWVVFGSIFIGAVHDFGALVVSLRNNGQTVGQIAGQVINRRVRVLFLLVLLMALTIVLAIFGLVIAAVFKQYPAAIIPCMVQIPIAVAIGLWVHRHGKNILVPSILALGVMYATVIFGNTGVLGDINGWLAGRSVIEWVAFLLVYSYVASVLPVWALLQPRDYINSLQLVTALGLVVIGLIVAAVVGGAPPAPGAQGLPLEIVAPAFKWDPAGAPLIFPFLFITIACGAISGFHCLVSSGTSSKQLASERDARFVGYGSMLTEGFLATVVILACVAGLGLGVMAHAGASATEAPTVLVGVAAWDSHYASWDAAGTLGAKIGAFVNGSANFLKALGLPAGVAVALMGVFVASFAGTTLDTACRLQRYVVQELATTLAAPGSLPPRDRASGRLAPTSEKSPASGSTAPGGPDHSPPPPPLHPPLPPPLHPRPRASLSLNPLTWLANKHGATIFAVGLAFAIAAMPAPGKDWSWATSGGGGMILWPLFGATNQLLAGLAFLVVAFYLWRRGKPIWFLVLPLIFMLIMPAWAMLYLLPDWLGADTKNWPLIVIGIATLALEAWMIVEALRMFPKVRGVLEAPSPDPTNHRVPATDAVGVEGV